MKQKLLLEFAITKDALTLSSGEVSALGMVQSVIVKHAATTSASALQFKEESVRHGAKVKYCSHKGCSKNAKKGGLCTRHGAKKKWTE